MDIRILQLTEGARQARGITVIIDVFRCFSLEPYLFALGAKAIRPVGAVEEALSWRKKDPSALLIGERKGIMLEGFDFGNSPSSVTEEAVSGRLIIHTTSAGTQGIVNAENADEVLTGSFVNAKATADYILSEKPEQVSLVCMGTMALRPNKEDTLCAEYLKSLLTGSLLPDIDERLSGLQYDGGEHFFDASKPQFPEEDFWMCIRRDIIPFPVRVIKDEEGFFSLPVTG